MSNEDSRLPPKREKLNIEYSPLNLMLIRTKMKF